MLSASGKISEIELMQTVLQCRALEAEIMSVVELEVMVETKELFVCPSMPGYIKLHLEEKD